MLVLKNAFRNISFLFLLIGTPLGLFSNNFQALDYVNTYTESFENGLINQNSISEDELSETSGMLASHKHYHSNTVTYYLFVDEFIQSFIEIPTSNVLPDSTTISSKYLAGRATVYNKQGLKAGICSASFLCMQNETGIYTDISNYLSVNNGLIVSWFTPTTLINLELDSIVHSMVTECIVKASTKIGFNPFYGESFNMVVSSDGGKIYFELRKI